VILVVPGPAAAFRRGENRVGSDWPRFSRTV